MIASLPIRARALPIAMLCGMVAIAGGAACGSAGLAVGEFGVNDGGGFCDDPAFVDRCPVADGVAWRCQRRFVYGTNWAWRYFGADFGGITAWKQAGVAKDSGAYSEALSQIKASGASVVRWWMFPRLWSDGILYDATDTPAGVSDGLLADLETALALAEHHDVYLMLTLFSFDSFTPAGEVSGIYAHGLKPLIVEEVRRKRLIANLVVPVVQAVERSINRHRVLAWDLINEPEWAMVGTNRYGGDGFRPQSDLEPVDHLQMETWLREMVVAIREHSRAWITLGSAAIKWSDAWQAIDVDFYQLHYYDWVYRWYPYQRVTLASRGLSDKPTVLGEYPIDGLSAIPSQNLPARSAEQLSAELWDAGYRGSLAWSYNDKNYPWDPQALLPFAQAKACETHYAH